MAVLPYLHPVLCNLFFMDQSKQDLLFRNDIALNIRLRCHERGGRDNEAHWLEISQPFGVLAVLGQSP